jgi:ubiquinone/menaquinone biosynthesis C-methylase UbiE
VDRSSWDERYRTEELVWKAEPNRFLVAEVGSLRPGRALDLACGEGRNALWLAERGWEVVGVDFSAVGLDKARSLAASRGLRVELVEADLREWDPPEASFDLVVLMYLHLPAADRRQVLAAASRALAPGGTLLVVGHDSTNLTDGVGGPQDASVLYTPDEIAAELSGVKLERAERVRRRLEDGREAIDALVRARRPGRLEPAGA